MPNRPLVQSFSLPADFKIDEVASSAAFKNLGLIAPPLGPIEQFSGTFSGTGFNTIFRPNSQKTPTQLPNGPAQGDNVLELNLTQETLSFSQALSNIPNRGSNQQADIFLNGVPYIQTVTDVTNPQQPVGIHFEPGIWLHVPATQIPNIGDTVARMASVPHGVTVEAQGKAQTINGKPNIPPVDITPFARGNPGAKNRFASQTAAAQGTPRIPQDLTPFIAAGTITQAILDDPNTILRNHIANQNIVSTTTLTIDTLHSQVPFGGGVDNIAFLMGDAAGGAAANANTIQMTATFWIETIEHIINIPPIPVVGHPPLILPAVGGIAGEPVPHFSIAPPHPILRPIQIKVHSTQIQYSQTVLLNFEPLSWPHVSVATLVPTGAISVPPSAWPAA